MAVLGEGTHDAYALFFTKVEKLFASLFTENPRRVLLGNPYPYALIA
jgi:hypothetical protein